MVSLDGASGFTGDMDVIAVGYNEEIGKFSLQHLKVGVDCEAEKKRAEAAALPGAYRIRYRGGFAREVVGDEDIRGLAVEKTDEGNERGKVLVERPPNSGTAVRVKSVFSIGGNVNAPGMLLEEECNGCSNNSAAVGDGRPKLQGLGKEEALDCFFKFFNSEAADEARENVSNDDRAKVTPVILRNRYAAAGV